MKLKLLGASAIALALGLGLVGAPAASAQTTYSLVWNDNGNLLCVPDTPHGSVIILIAGPCAAISFINRYTTSNGNAWWELQMNDGLCLNWNDPDYGGDGYLYADSCIPGDGNELFYNHVKGQLISLAGNQTSDQDTWLEPYPYLYIDGNPAWWGLSVTTSSFGQWSEPPS